MSDDVSIGLSGDQALVLFEWLARAGAGEQPAAFEDLSRPGMWVKARLKRG